MKFRKKPIVIEAVKVPMGGLMAENAEGWGRLISFLGNGQWQVADDLGIDITTLEGVMHALPGDWIIRGVKGEFYPRKPDIFAASYESAE